MKKNNAKNNVTREDALSIRNMTDAEFQQWYKSLYTNPEDAESEEVNDKLSDDFTAFDEPMKEPESSKNKLNDAFADLIADLIAFSEEDKTNTDEIEEFAGGFEDINEPDASDDTSELDSDSEQDNLSDEDENPFAGGFEDIDEADTSELESESEQEELEDMVTESLNDLSDDEEEPEVSPEGLNDMGGFFENTNPIKVKVEPDATNSDEVYVSLSDLIRIITVIVNGLNKK